MLAAGFDEAGALQVFCWIGLRFGAAVEGATTEVELEELDVFNVVVLVVLVAIAVAVVLTLVVVVDGFVVLEVVEACVTDALKFL